MTQDIKSYNVIILHFIMKNIDNYDIWNDFMSDAVSIWRKAMGHRDSRIAQVQDPSSVRACYGVDEIQNACHG